MTLSGVIALILIVFFSPNLSYEIFRTSNTEIVAECQHYFGFSLPSKLIEIKRNEFMNNYIIMCHYGYHLTVGLSWSSLLSVYLFRFQLYLLFVFATMIMVNTDYHITVSTFASLFHDCILPHETIDYCMQRDWQSPKSTEYAHDTDSCSSVMACILTILRSTFYPLTLQWCRKLLLYTFEWTLLGRLED